MTSIHDTAFEKLGSGALLLTASDRQSRWLRDAYGRWMQANGRSAWRSPGVIVWGAWLERCWTDLAAGLSQTHDPHTRVLLTPEQEAGLWEATVRASPDGARLLEPRAAAMTAAEAWRLCADWEVPVPSVEQSQSDDCRAFAGWASRFAARCHDDGWQDRAHLEIAVADAFKSGRLEPPRCLLLYGFEEFTRQQERLLESVRARGAAVEPIAPGAGRATVVRHEFPGPTEEVATAARWARRKLEQGATRVAVVVPELSRMRAPVVRIFEEAFVPRAVLPAGAGPGRPFNVSLGQPLSEYPLIRTAFEVLELGAHGLTVEEASSLLRSPFIGAAQEERDRRALLDVACRRGEPLVRLDRLIRLAGETTRDDRPRAHASPRLAEALAAWRTRRDGFPHRQLPSAWAEEFARALELVRWPGDRPLQSDEYQAVEAWRDLLTAFTSLDILAERVDLGQAVAALTRLARERVFQPESPEVPVQVIGMLEATGLEFDGIWITGLHDGIWPGSPRPNPFIAIEQRRRHRLPHSSAAREIEFARAVLERLSASAPEVIVSHPRRRGDEELRPSPLIASHACAPGEGAGLGGVAQYVQEAGVVLERMADERAPELAPAVRVRRGTAVFRDQAACPFRAFAHARLGAVALGEPEPGLDPAARGDLLHRVMKMVWAGMPGHAALCATSPMDLAAQVRRAAKDVVSAMARERPDTLTPHFCALETERLTHLVLSWLDIEKQRAPFTVRSLETERTMALGGVHVRIVPDRVDDLADGRRMVIDYKAGDPTSGQWFGDRPDDPQIPLYATVEENLAAVAFGRVRRQDVGFVGIAAADGIAPGLKVVSALRDGQAPESWDELLAHWRRVLTSLAEAFRTGDARVAPKDPRTTCTYCDLGPLCRIHEREPGVPADGADA